MAGPVDVLPHRVEIERHCVEPLLIGEKGQLAPPTRSCRERYAQMAAALTRQAVGTSLR